MKHISAPRGTLTENWMWEYPFSHFFCCSQVNLQDPYLKKQKCNNLPQKSNIFIFISSFRSSNLAMIFVKRLENAVKYQFSKFLLVKSKICTFFWYQNVPTVWKKWKIGPGSLIVFFTLLKVRVPQFILLRVPYHKICLLFFHFLFYIVTWNIPYTLYSKTSVCNSAKCLSCCCCMEGSLTLQEMGKNNKKGAKLGFRIWYQVLCCYSHWTMLCLSKQGTVPQPKIRNVFSLSQNNEYCSKNVKKHSLKRYCLRN